MRIEKVVLTNDREDVYLEAYIADKLDKFQRKAMLVIPGGGYAGVCSDREGEPIALSYVSKGFNAFVLHYTVDQKHAFPIQLIETAMAIKHIKDNSEEYGINRDELYVVGFSAGGHLAACAGALWKHSEIYKTLDMTYSYNKPKGVILMYPVISTDHHGFSFNNLLCKDQPLAEELETVSVEKHIDGDSAPAFILHTVNDKIVDVKNSLCLANAYTNAGVSYEMHIYPDAPHGIALGNKITAIGVEKFDNPEIAKWVDMSVCWMESL